MCVKLLNLLSETPAALTLRWLMLVLFWTSMTLTVRLNVKGRTVKTVDLPSVELKVIILHSSVVCVALKLSKSCTLSVKFSSDFCITGSKNKQIYVISLSDSNYMYSKVKNKICRFLKKKNSWQKNQQYISMYMKSYGNCYILKLEM